MTDVRSDCKACGFMGGGWLRLSVGSTDVGGWLAVGRVENGVYRERGGVKPLVCPRCGTVRIEPEWQIINAARGAK